jgi:prephenate dehydrogenase
LIDHLGIVGVGLIGASIGRAARERGLARRVTGVGRSKQSLDQALALGAIDSATTVIDADLADADFLVVATPISKVVDAVARSREVLSTSSVVTDAASTKAGILRDLAHRASENESAPFVGSHPMAGSHRQGPSASDPNLFEGRTCIITPDASTPASAVERVRRFWTSLGMRVVEMSAEEHDERIARISHLPHLASYALALSAEERDTPLAGPGFRDTTRLAASPAALWAEIVRENRSAVLDALARYIQNVDELRRLIVSEAWGELEKRLTDANRRLDCRDSED